MTCKQLIVELHNYIWIIFWLSISVHVFLGVFIPLVREFFKELRYRIQQNINLHNQHSRDHEDLAAISKRHQVEQ